MEFRNCIECGKLFRFISRNRCPDCIAAEENEFSAVYKYLKENRKARIKHISKATGVSISKIVRFLRDNRLKAFKIDAEGWLSCSRCGKPINARALCDDCSGELAREIYKSSAQQTSIDQIINIQKPQLFTADLRRSD